MNGALPPASMETLDRRSSQPITISKWRRVDHALFQTLCGQAVQQLCYGCATRKRDLPDRVVLAHLAPDVSDVCLCRDDVNDARRDTCASRQLYAAP